MTIKTKEERVLLEKELRKALSEMLLNTATRLHKTSHIIGDLYISETDPELRIKWYRLGLICDKLTQQQKRNTLLFQDGGALALQNSEVKKLPREKT